MKKRVLSLLMAFALCLGLSTMAGAAEKVAEVTIGDTTTQYADITEAFAAAQAAESAAVKLLQNVTLPITKTENYSYSYGIRLTSGNITLDLNGHTIQTTEVGGNFFSLSAVFYIEGSKSSHSSLTVQDNSTGGDGEIVQPNGGQAIHVGDEGTLTVESGAIEVTSTNTDQDSSTTQNCAVFLTGGGTADIQGGTLSGNKGIYVKNGTLTVSDGTINGRSSYALLVAEGAVTENKSTVQLSGGTYTAGADDGCSIQNSDGPAANLLVNGYRYQDETGKESKYSEDNKGVAGNTIVAVRPANEFPYMDENGTAQTRENCTKLTADGFTGINAESTAWFVADASFTADNTLQVLGTVNLILCDGVTVTLNKGISLNGYYTQPATLNIYAQSGGTGKLICIGESGSGCAGIYDNSNSDGRETVLNIYGGTVTATGTSKSIAPGIMSYGAGIGTDGSYGYNSTMAVNIYGGTVTARSGGEGAQAIGNGTNANGTVTVTIAPGMKCVRTDDLSTPCEYGNTDGTSVTVTKCNEHKWEYTYTENGNTHTKTCTLCNTVGGSEAHRAETYVFVNDSQHNICCACGKVMATEGHAVRYTPNTDGLTHRIDCNHCGLTPVNQPHDFQNGDCVCHIRKAAEYGEKEYASLQAAIDAAAASGGTVTLARDVAENVTVADGAVTVDLNENKWMPVNSGADLPIPLTVTGGSVTLKRGTLIQGDPTRGDVGIQIRGGSVTVEGDAVVIGSNKDNSATLSPSPAIELESGYLTLETGATLVYGLEVPDGKTLSKYLPTGTAFGLRSCDETGTWTVDNGLFAGAYTTNEYAVHNMALVVVAHTHGFTGGSTCACGYVCDHSAGMNEANGNCKTCGNLLAAASVTVGEEKPSYYENIHDAFDAAKVSGGTLTLLQDVTLPENENISITTPVGTGEYNFTIDWNGHTLSGNTWQNLLTFSDRTNVTLKDSSDSNAGGVRNTYNAGGIAVCVSVLNGCCVTIEGGTYSAQVWKRDCAGDLKISGGVFENPSNTNVRYALYSIRGGSDDGSLADLLVDGYTFAYDENGKKKPFDVYASAHTEAGKTVYVVAHTHEYTASGACACGAPCPHNVDDNGKCKDCGGSFAARVDNAYYTTVTEALGAVQSGKTVTLLANVTEPITVSNIQNIFYLDLNGKTIKTLTVSGSETPRLLDNAENKGSIGKLTYNSGILASLLRGGWGFKSGDGWLKADALFGASADNVSVAETRITGVGAGGGGTISYGSTATVTATANLNGLTGLSYQWYERISGSWEVVSNATESSYSSSTLSLGDHYFTCAVTDGDGAVVLSGVASVQVEQANIAGADITPQANSGNTGDPADNRLVVVPESTTELANAFDNVTYQFEVTYNGNKLTLGTDYEIESGSSGMNAGDYTLKVKGIGNYTGTAEKVWTIEPYELSGKYLPTQINKPYDGTTEGENITHGKEALGIFEIDSSNTRNPKVDTTFLPQIKLYNCFTLSNMHFDSPEVGERTFTFTITLNTNDFVFAGGNKTAEISLVRDGSAAVSISKADAPTNVPHGALTVYNQTKRTYEVDLLGLLPKLDSPKSYGTVTGGTVTAVKLSDGYYTSGGAEIKDGKLLLPIESVSSTTTGEIGAVTVTVTTTNYKDMTLTIDVSAANQPSSGGGGGSSGGSTTTNTETTTNPDGSTTKTETKSDGTVIETTTGKDGSVSKTESKTTTKSDGTTVETVTETNTNADGSKSTSKTETTTNKDGSKTESKSETKTEADGTKSETKSEMKTDASGVTNGTETTKTTAPDGSTGATTTTTENGNTKTEAEAKVSEKAVEDAKKSGEAVKVPTEVKAGENSNSAPTVKVELPKNAGETKIEIPVSDVNSGTVAIIVHPDGTEEIVKDSVPTKDGVQLTVDGSATIKIIDNSKDFIDTRDHWSRDEVNFVASREIFNGVGNNLFGVGQPMTRGMVNTVLARLAGVDTTPKNGQKWYEVGTAWAKANGITDGTNPEASVTREQLATLLYRFYGTPAVSGTLSFADAHEVSDYAQSALLWATQNGIMNGVGNDRVAPGADAQRAQVAAMLARYLKNAG